MRSRGIVAEIRATSSGQAGALHFLHRVDGRNTQNGCAARGSFGDDAIDLLGGDQGAHGVMHQNDFGGRIDLRERVGDRLLAAVAAVNYAHRAAEAGFADFVLQEDDVIGARRDEEVGNRRAGREAAQRENDERHAIEFEELLGRVGAHARA